MNSYIEIQKNLMLFEEEKSRRMQNPFYRIRFEIYKLKKKVLTWII